MFRLLPTTTAAFLFTAAAAFPQAGLGPVIQTLESQGFTVTQTTRETNRIRIQAQRGDESRELVYDSRTGDLLSDDVMPLQDRDQDRLKDGTHDGEPDQDRDRDRDNTQDMDKDQTQDGSGNQAQGGSGKK